MATEKDDEYNWIADLARKLFSAKNGPFKLIFSIVVFAVAFLRGEDGYGVTAALFLAAVGAVGAFALATFAIQGVDMLNGLRPVVRFKRLVPDMKRVWHNERRKHPQRKYDLSLLEDEIAYKLERCGIRWNKTHVQTLIDLANRNDLATAQKQFPFP